MQGLKSFGAARVPATYQEPQAIAMTTHAELGPDQQKNVIEQSMKVTGNIPFSSKLHYLLVNKLNHMLITPMKEAMMQGVEEAVAKIFEPGFQAVNTGINSAFFCFLDMA